jgi:hypothetical protein
MGIILIDLQIQLYLLIFEPVKINYLTIYLYINSNKMCIEMLKNIFVSGNVNFFFKIIY